jgi:hypothetical protein
VYIEFVTIFRLKRLEPIIVVSAISASAFPSLLNVFLFSSHQSPSYAIQSALAAASA